MWQGVAATTEKLHVHSVASQALLSFLLHESTDIFEPPRGLPLEPA